MIGRLLAVAALIGLAAPALAQNSTAYPTQPQPAPQSAYPPPAQSTYPPPAQSTYPPPAQSTYPPPSQPAPQPAYPPPAQTAPQAAPQAAPQTAAPQPGASQQVVVNPATPGAPGQTTAPSNVQVNPGVPAQASYPPNAVVVEEHHRSRSPMAIVLTDSLYGGGAGALVGLGVGLIEQGSYARDVLIGTGVGLLAGSVVGGIHAYSNSTGNDIVAQRAHARDGLGTLTRYRDMQPKVHQLAALTLTY